MNPFSVEGTPFGRYLLAELIGRGGMGEVWRAYDTETERAVAVKLLPAMLADDANFAQRFRREAQTAAQLNNAHIIPIHHFGDIDGRLYVDMRLVDGHDLQAEILGPVHPDRAVAIVEQIASALYAAHSVGLIHRDVKPSNILLDEDDFAYLIDFGISRAADDAGATATGITLGTWAYMAPERFSSVQLDARSDIYSLACVLFECLTGQRPYPGESLQQIAAAHMFAPPPCPSLIAGVPVGFDEVIATGMAKKPEQRYPTAKDFAVAARQALASPLVATRRAATGFNPSASPLDPTQQRDAASAAYPAARSRRTAWLIGGAVALVVVVGAAVVGMRYESRSSTLTSGTIASSTTPRRGLGDVAYGAQVVLPFVDLIHPRGIGVDGASKVFVADDLGRLSLLAPGDSQPATLSLPDLTKAMALTVDSKGNTFIADTSANRIIEVVSGAPRPTVLPITGLHTPAGVTVDASGNVFVADSMNDRILELPVGATEQIVVPFVGLRLPLGIAVDGDGVLYVADARHNRVVKLVGGVQTDLPFNGLAAPYGIALDAEGDVYVADSQHDRLVKLAAAATQQTQLPFVGLKHPVGVTVDQQGNVYVTDDGNNRVVKLPPAA